MSSSSDDSSGAPGFRGLPLGVAVLVAAATATWATATPAPAPRSAPATSFSAMRARDDLAWIAPEPHPTGSPANARVRDHLLHRLAELGVAGEVQRVENVETHHRNAPAPTVTIENVIARVPGSDPHAAPLLLMAHYDSVPGSPGAADDGAGVAALLEIVRIAHGPGPTKRDLIFLFSDGEELGLLGAHQFFASHPLAKHIGATLNLESRGGAGRAYLFETGPHSDELVRALAGWSDQLSSASFATFVYEHMPNGTDFTVAKQAGSPGLNFAFIADPAQYHSPTSTVEALDLGSLQHIGNEVLASVRCFDSLPSFKAPDETLAWSDLLGRRLVIYGPVGGWLVVVFTMAFVAWAVLRAWRQPGGIRLGAVLRGPLFALAAMVGAGILLFLSTPVALAPGSPGRFAHLLELCSRFEFALLLLALGAVILAARFTLPTAAGDRNSAWIGLLSLGLALTGTIQAAAPRLAPPIAWPLLAASVGAVAIGSSPKLARTWWTLTATLALAMTFCWAHMVFLGIGMARPPALAIFALVGSFGALPLVAELAYVRWSIGALVAGLGFAVAFSLRLSR